MQIANHGDGLAALLFPLLKESDLVAGIVSELEKVGEHTACKHLNTKHLHFCQQATMTELKPSMKTCPAVFEI